MVRIRGYDSSDARVIVKLHNESNRFFEDTDITEGFIESIAHRGDYAIFIAEEEREVTGFAGVLYYASNGRAEIGPIIVSQGHQRKGVGGLLMTKILGFLEDNGIHRAIAKVKSFNAPARSFFEQAGFEKEAELLRYTKNKEAVVQYVRFVEKQGDL